MQFLDPETLAPVRALELPGPLTGLGASPDGTRLVVLTDAPEERGLCQLFDVASGDELARVSLDVTGSKVQWSRSGDAFVFRSKDQIHVYGV